MVEVNGGEWNGEGEDFVVAPEIKPHPALVRATEWLCQQTDAPPGSSVMVDYLERQSRDTPWRARYQVDGKGWTFMDIPEEVITGSNPYQLRDVAAMVVFRA